MQDPQGSKLNKKKKKGKKASQHDIIALQQSMPSVGSPVAKIGAWEAQVNKRLQFLQLLSACRPVILCRVQF